MQLDEIWTQSEEMKYSHDSESSPVRYSGWAPPQVVYVKQGKAAKEKQSALKTLYPPLMLLHPLYTLCNYSLHCQIFSICFPFHYISTILSLSLSLKMNWINLSLSLLWILSPLFPRPFLFLYPPTTILLKFHSQEKHTTPHHTIPSSHKTHYPPLPFTISFFSFHHFPVQIYL